MLIYTRGPTGSNAHAGGVPATDANSVPLSGGDWQDCVFLPPGKMEEMHTIEHETGHQLGFIHEQRRNDDCSTVTIDETCLSANADANGNHPFKTVAGAQNLAPYDTDSIMEYGNDSFCDPLAAPGCNDGTAANPHCARDATFTQADIPGMNPESGDQFGAALAAGDIDGDGISDLAIWLALRRRCDRDSYVADEAIPTGR